MFKDCMRVVSVQLLNFFNVNELRYTKDKKKRNNGIMLGVSALIVASALIGYVVSMSYSLAMLQLTKYIPANLLATTSVVILVFTILKASGVLFSAKDYDMLMSFPLRPLTVVVSRFLSMYFGNLVFSCLMMIPSGVVYAVFVHPSPVFYLFFLISIFIIPLLPMTIASIIGTLITAISARMKHRNLVNILLSLLLMLGVMSVSLFSGKLENQQLTDLSKLMAEQINRVYPMASIFTSAIADLNITAFLQFIGISLVVFAAFAYLVARRYTFIMTTLQSRATKGNYVFTQSTIASPTRTLYEKEWKRYFSSPIYVLNTAFGYVILLALSATLCILGPEKTSELLQLPDITPLITQYAPIAIGSLVALAPATASSISLEGKQWWIPLSLPITSKMLFDSKIRVSLTLSIPTSILASTLIALRIPFTPLNFLLLYLTPITYCTFQAIIGITINARFPHLTWGNEATVIKQSLATLLSMLVGMLTFLLPVLLFQYLPTLPPTLLTSLITLILFLLTLFLYHTNNKIHLPSIGA